MLVRVNLLCGVLSIVLNRDKTLFRGMERLGTIKSELRPSPSALTWTIATNTVSFATMYYEFLFIFLRTSLGQCSATT